jgi:hypothetical protein
MHVVLSGLVGFVDWMGLWIGWGLTSHQQCFRHFVTWFCYMSFDIMTLTDTQDLFLGLVCVRVCGGSFFDLKANFMTPV